MQEVIPLSAIWRWYIYGMHGFATEIIFTAMWDVFAGSNRKIMGYTSLWTLPIYGMHGCVVEKLYGFLSARNVPLLVRALVYLIWTYIWEFSTGFILKQFDLCPWDYTHYDLDFMGIVTLEYAPLWYIATIMTEVIVMKTTKHLYWGPKHEEFMSGTKGAAHTKAL